MYYPLGSHHWGHFQITQTRNLFELVSVRFVISFILCVYTIYQHNTIRAGQIISYYLSFILNPSELYSYNWLHHLLLGKVRTLKNFYRTETELARTGHHWPTGKLQPGHTPRIRSSTNISSQLVLHSGFALPRRWKVKGHIESIADSSNWRPWVILLLKKRTSSPF